jgi:hypothetical protein
MVAHVASTLLMVGKQDTHDLMESSTEPRGVAPQTHPARRASVRALASMRCE